MMEGKELYRVICERNNGRLHIKEYFIIVEAPCQLGKILEQLSVNGDQWSAVHRVGVEYNKVPNIFVKTEK